MAIEIPESMVAAQLVEYKKAYKIGEVKTPGSNLGEHDMLVKIAVASLCHTDGMVSNGDFETKLPCIPSHEGSGTVVRVGSGVTKFEIGDRCLCGLIYHRCGTCPDCTGPEQNNQYCANVGGMNGVTKDGNFAEYGVVDARECCKLPDNLSFQSAAPLACAGITVWGGLVRADLKEGQTIAIVGAGGGLGHLGVQFAKALGLKVIAIDARDEALSLAKECGADTLIDAREGKEKAVEAVKKVTDGNCADATLSLSDNDTAAALSAAVTKMHGTVVQIAQPVEVKIPFAEFIFRDIKVIGSLISSRGECEKMLKVVSEQEVRVKTNPFNGIKEVPKAVELAHSGKMQGKPVIIIDQEALEKEKKSGLTMV